MAWDIPTLIAVTILLIAGLGALQLWLWRQDRALTVLAIWGAAHLLAAVGFALLAGRMVLPLRLSIDIANAIVVLSYALVWVGARRFEHKPVSIGVAVGGAALWLAACQVPQFYPHLVLRTMLISVIIATYDLLTMCEFLRRRGGDASPLRRALAVTFGLHALVQAVRIAGAIQMGFDQAPFSIPNSNWFAVPAMAGLILAMGMSVLLIAVAKDDAQRHAIAVLREARDTAEQANIAKSRFLARMSHELRTPLNGVLGMAQVLTRDRTLSRAQHEQAGLVEQAGRHLLAIVNDILDLARAESGKLELFPRPVLVREIVDVTTALVADMAAGGSVTLRVRHAAGSPVAVKADPLRVRQILLNLLGNAIKFTPPGGQVTLSVAPLDGVEGLRLSVLDTGPGVPPEVRPYLFQDFMFGQTDNTTIDGTGMGLAISASLAQAMGGIIGYQPGADGVGSLFTVDLPLPTAEPPPLPKAPPPPPPVEVAPTPSAVRRVLVVDDVAANRRLAEVLLKKAGFAVDLAVDGTSALAALETGPLPDVVLMDVYMPGMDGLTAARHIRALAGPIGRLPIIALTADASPDQIRACHQAGMNSYLAKPFNVQDLLDAIEACSTPPSSVAD